MLFNSFEFLIFLPVVFLLYWFVFARTIQLRNLFLVVVSYVFYGWWDYRFLALIAFSSVLDYFIGKHLGHETNSKKRKYLLWVSLISNLGLLGVFKYFGFFIDSFSELLLLFGMNPNITTLKILLPVGISFYTFQTLSYTIDIYRRQLKPTDNLLAFLAFVSFFPQLVAGPIERAKDLLPQFFKIREFSYPLAVDGLRQILWGFFKKVVIADNCAIYANEIFNNYGDHGPVELTCGAIFFAFQIYGDFSGYSDIAIGTSKLFGFKLRQNFAYPYFSRDIGEFWRRWHISLSTWFRDYVYIPLGGSRVSSKSRLAFNTIAVFTISGFWHGANWTFMAWGLLNGLLFLPLILGKRNRNNMAIVATGNMLPSLSELFHMLLTFALICLTWIFFRAETITDAFHYIAGFGGDFTVSFSYLSSILAVTIGISIMLIVEWMHREYEYGFKNVFGLRSRVSRYGIYSILLLAIFTFTPEESSEFIYFQF